MRIISELLKLSSSLFGHDDVEQRGVSVDGEENVELHVQNCGQVGWG